MGIIENLLMGMTGQIVKPHLPNKVRARSSSPVKHRRATTGAESQFALILPEEGLAGQEEYYSLVKGTNFRITTRKKSQAPEAEQTQEWANKSANSNEPAQVSELSIRVFSPTTP